jgi:hypothetical protein
MTVRLNGFCKRGHSVSGDNVIICSGGYKGRKYKNCKVCFTERRRIHLKKKYRTDEAYREKKKAKASAYYHSHKIGASRAEV